MKKIGAIFLGLALSCSNPKSKQCIEQYEKNALIEVNGEKMPVRNGETLNLNSFIHHKVNILSEDIIKLDDKIIHHNKPTKIDDVPIEYLNYEEDLTTAKNRAIISVIFGKTKRYELILEDETVIKYIVDSDIWTINTNIYNWNYPKNKRMRLSINTSKNGHYLVDLDKDETIKIKYRGNDVDIKIISLSRDIYPINKQCRPIYADIIINGQKYTLMEGEVYSIDNRLISANMLYEDYGGIFQIYENNVKIKVNEEQRLGSTIMFLERVYWKED